MSIVHINTYVGQCYNTVNWKILLVKNHIQAFDRLQKNKTHENFLTIMTFVLRTRIWVNMRIGRKNEVSKALQGWITWALIHYDR